MFGASLPHAHPLYQALLQHRNGLINDFTQVVAEAVGHAHAANPSPQEPDVVALLLLKGVPRLGAALARRLTPAGFQTRVGALFCHQRPEVSYLGHDGQKKSCELGDLLILHRHRDHAQAAPCYRSLLLQAKWAQGTSVTLHGNELKQLELYRFWPRFGFSRSGRALNGLERSVFPKGAHEGAQYLLLDKAAPATMTVHPASGETLYPQQAFPERLVELLLGREGRSVLPFPECGGVDWSALVWDLVGFAKQAVFNRRNIGLHDVSRSVNLAFTGDRKQTYVSYCDGSEQSQEAKGENTSAFLEWLDGIAPPLPPGPKAATEADEPVALPLLFIDTLGDADAAALGADEGVIASADLTWPPVTQREAVEQYALRLITARHERACFADFFERFEHGPCLMRCLEEAAEMLPENDRMKGMLQVATELETLGQDAQSDDADKENSVDCRATIQAVMIALL